MFVAATETAKETICVNVTKGGQDFIVVIEKNGWIILVMAYLLIMKEFAVVMECVRKNTIIHTIQSQEVLKETMTMMTMMIMVMEMDITKMMECVFVTEVGMVLDVATMSLQSNVLVTEEIMKMSVLVTEGVKRMIIANVADDGQVLDAVEK